MAYFWGKDPWGMYLWGASSLTNTELIITLPMVEVAMESTSVPANMAITLLVPTVVLHSGSALKVKVPIVTVVMTSTNVTANMAIALNRIIVRMVGGWVVPATMNITLPMVEVAMTSPGGTYATMVITLPVIEFYGVMSGLVYTTVVASTKDGSVTAYTNHSFNSYFECKGEFYGVNSTGIYHLTGINDSGTDITGHFITGYTDFKSPKVKSPIALYTGMESSGVVEVRNVIDNIKSAIYEYAATDRYMVRKLKFGKGRVGGKIGLDISSNKAFQINSCKILAEESKVYHPGKETWMRVIVPSVSVTMVSN